jgi:WD40 repeat protein
VPHDLLEVIEPVCDAFERAWREGQRPVIEQYLRRVAEPARGLLTAELLCIELEWRFRRGERPAAEEYGPRFPTLATALGAWVDEARAVAGRSLPEPPPGLTELDTRLASGQPRSDRPGGSDKKAAPPAEAREPTSGSSQARARRESLVEAFAAAWERGERPALDQFLVRANAAETGLLFDLAQADLQWRLEAGEKVRVEDYMRRYPRLSEGGPRLLELIARELAWRREAEPGFSADEYLKRFPQFAAELRPLLRFAGPEKLGLELLLVAAEAITSAIAGCADVLRPNRQVHPGLRGGARQDAIDRFGPPIIARWAEWLGARSKEDQRRAIVQLAGLESPTATHAADRAINRLRITASLDDKRMAVDYLATIPATTRRVMVPDPDSEQLTDTPSAVLDERVLLRFLPVNPAPFPSGSELPGTPYRLEELLGIGGFGAVYKATNRYEQNTPPRAIKFCLNPDMLVTLHRERQMLDRLMSAGTEAQWSDRVVKLLGHSLDAPVPFLVYEYISGGCLTARLAALRRQTGQNLRPAQVLGLVRRICEAISFVHTRGLVHRDVKPSNILVSGNTIKLADFGIGGVVADYTARIGSHGGSSVGLTASEKCSVFRGAGTPLYMSPEQRQGDPPEPSHDVYSIGVMWYQLLVGDFTRELHPGWADELAEEFDVPHRQIELIAQCVGYLKKRPASAKELLALLPPPTMPQAPPTRKEPAGEVRTITGHEGRVNGVAFFRDSRRLLSAASDGTARVWDADEGRQLACYRLHARSALCAALSPDNRQALIGCDDRNAWLLDLARGSDPRCFAGHTGLVNCVAFSPDGRRAVTGGTDGTVRLWHVASGREALRIEEGNRPVTGVAFTPDGLFIVSCSEDGSLRAWDGETGWEARELTTQANWLLCLAVSPDGRHVACGGKETLALWSLENGQAAGTFDGHTLSVMSVAFSSNGRWLLSGGMDKTVRYWDVASRRPVASFEVRTHTIRAVALAPDGNHAASGGEDRTIRLYALPRN